MFDWTNYSNMTRLQINVDTILFSNRQFDSFFDATHTVIGVTRAHKSVKLPFVTKDSKHLVGKSDDDSSTLIKFTPLWKKGVKLPFVTKK